MSEISASTIQVLDFVFDRLTTLGYAALSDVQRQFVCAWSACGEIDNGGLWQFFYNTSGDWCHDTPAALLAYEAPELAEIVTAAISMFPAKAPNKDMDVRRRQIGELSEDILASWDELSESFNTALMDRKFDTFVGEHLAELYAQ